MDGELNLRQTRRLRRHSGVILAVWLLLLAIQQLSPFFLSERFFCFREWECVVANDRPFKPWVRWQGISYGDLANTAGVPQLKHFHPESFTADEYGFRNPPGQYAKGPQVVIVGDSFAAGSQLSDDEVLPALIEKELGIPAYNYANNKLPSYFGDRRFIARPPRVVLAFHVERETDPALFQIPDDLQPFDPVRFASFDDYRQRTGGGTDRRLRALVKAIRRDNLFGWVGERLLKGGLWSLGLYALPEQIFYYQPRTGYLFSEKGGRAHLDLSKLLGKIEPTVAALRDAKEKLAARGTRLIVLIAPDKETVYHDQIPALRDKNVGEFLARFNAALDAAGVENLPVLPLFAADRAAHPDEDLYFPDDTHLTARGQRVIFDALRDRLAAGGAAETK
ncbi:MAG: hypothetical protein GX444_12600 [Myxococcales bacterium]|nr:hypothetical protein [Myxococcales bacterium]